MPERRRKMEDKMKIVEFDKWCPSCKFSNRTSTKEPCDTCLGVPARENSHKPECWQEKRK